MTDTITIPLKAAEKAVRNQARVNKLEAELREARVCLRNAMEFICDIMQCTDVDIDHDKIWKRWKRAAQGALDK